jgi:CBS domain-containing protein
MSAPPIVAHLATPLADIVRTMLAEQIGSVLIVDDEGRLTGIVMESDFAGDDPAIPLAAYQVAQLFQPSVSEAAIQQVRQVGGSLTAARFMTYPVETVSEDESLGDVVRSMLERGIARVPVVRDGVPVGIVARHDLLRLLLPADSNADGVTRRRG